MSENPEITLGDTGLYKVSVAFLNCLLKDNLISVTEYDNSIKQFKEIYHII